MISGEAKMKRKTSKFILKEFILESSLSQLIISDLKEKTSIF